MHYGYLTLNLARGRASWAAVSAHAKDTATRAISNAGGEFLGLFSPQLGFASNEATVLLRWPEETRYPAKPIFALPEVVARSDEKLVPTVRPRVDQRLRSGGIYVHRWFMIDADKTYEFVDLSNRAWAAFEGSYDTEIFGLFLAAPTETDRQAGTARLLLLTWYRDHGVWEASREQAHDAKSLFAQRHLLTRSTIGRSSVLVV